MSTPLSAEYEQLTFPRARRRSQSDGARATILRTRLSRLDYHALMKADVDTGTGSPRIEPDYSPAQITVCLTAYNEGVEAYHDSLAALARGADHFVGAGEPRIAREFTICILVDGLERMSPSFAEYAQRLGIYQPTLLDRSADYHVFESTIDRHLLKVAPGELQSREAAAREAGPGTLANLSADSGRQRVVLLIKAQNRGKLDSHRCFFEVACRRERPGHFLQVDVGTTPDPDAIFEMWRAIAGAGNVAAVSARSHMPQPRGADLLGAWQYGDIAIERILLWPTEVLMGYMSVLSGQFCLTRSDAVWRRHDPGAGAGEGGGEGAIVSSTEDGRVMRSYLRGLERLGPFESNMFLAEDRILGLEIVFQPDSRWELGYVPTASAGIDRCETWNELLCQRRRWKCSSVTCRLWMFTRVLDYVKSAKRTLAQRARIVSATTFHALYFLVEWLMPAFTVMIFSSLHHIAAANASGPLRVGIDASYWALLGLLALQLGVSAAGRITAASNRFYAISVSFQSVYTLGMGALAVALAWGTPGLAGTLALAGVTLGTVLLLGKGYAREVFQGLKRSLLTYWPARPGVAFLIMTYAALNSHDTSWGTKGLTRPDYLDVDNEPRRYRRAHFERFRLGTVGLMLAANLGFYTFADSRGWLDSFTALRLVFALLLAQVGIAFLGRIAIALRERRSR